MGSVLRAWGASSLAVSGTTAASGVECQLVMQYMCNDNAGPLAEGPLRDGTDYNSPDPTNPQARPSRRPDRRGPAAGTRFLRMGCRWGRAAGCCRFPGEMPALSSAECVMERGMRLSPKIALLTRTGYIIINKSEEMPGQFGLIKRIDCRMIVSIRHQAWGRKQGFSCPLQRMQCVANLHKTLDRTVKHQ